MGHSKASKANTHARLVDAAAARFKERGVDGISLSDLMHDLSLTHGGFYKHFASRDELVAEALQLALADSANVMRQRLFDATRPDLAGFVDFYLDEAHRDGRAHGCAVAALAGDAPRKSAAVQGQFREQIEANLSIVGEALDQGRSLDERRSTAIVVLGALYGALIMARAVGDSALSSEILTTTRKRLKQLVGVARRPRPRAKAKSAAAIRR